MEEKEEESCNVQGDELDSLFQFYDHRGSMYVKWKDDPGTNSESFFQELLNSLLVHYLVK